MFSCHFKSKTPVVWYGSPIVRFQIRMITMGLSFSLLIIFYMTLLSEAVFFFFSFAIFLPTFTLPAFQIPLHNAF